MRFITKFLKIFILLPLLFLLECTSKNNDWSKATRESAKIAPLPNEEPEALVQLYTAKAWSWRGNFSVHAWIATKEKNADSYTTYNVMAWGRHFGAPGVVVVVKDLPDRYWYGSKPTMIFSARGKKAEEMIPQIQQAAKSYPYQDFYRAYPGPNSNSFISHIMRHTSGFDVELPSNAIGKDWIDDGKFFGKTETGSGVQFSLYGMFGLTLGIREGIEINIIGLSFGIDFLRPALKLPIVGRVGMKDDAANNAAAL